jgi:hypothetical protein
MKRRYLLPPQLHGEGGQPRKVGIEIELAGLDVKETSELVMSLYGGEVEPINRWGNTIKGTSLGDFRVEIDSHLLKEDRHRNFLAKLGISDTGQDKVENAIESLATKLIPSEIACPPIAIRELSKLDPLRDDLLERGALGTRASLLYAFGFQLNPEVPSLTADSLRRHLAAFMLLYDFIVAESQIDITRRIAPFIDPYPEEYRYKILSRTYAPDMDRLIDDYLEYNPTRNRPVDMLPLFAYLDEEKVMARCKEPTQVKKRPTFHYRLPNCLIDEPGWNFSTEWNRWVAVERLAADPSRLRVMSDVYLDLAAKPFGFRKKRWIEKSAAWVGG